MELSRFYAGAVAAISATWWGILILVPSSRDPFLWQGVPEAVLLVFVPADLVFIVVLPALYAWKGKQEHWILFCGAFGYAAILTFALCIQYQSGWMGAILMTFGVVANTALSLEMRRR